MKNKTSIASLRVFVIFGLVFVITEFIFKTGVEPAFIENPSISLFLISVLLGLIGMESFMVAEKKLGHDKTQATKIHVATKGGFKALLKKLWGAKPMEKEKDILLDHDYDGIKELDNSLPPWWLYSFYASMVFAVLYLGYYHILGGNSNLETFEEEMELARIEIEKYKQEHPNEFDASSVTVSSNTDAGQKIFKSYCAACHAFDGGGGIGPNLTDEYWILGGGIQNIYNTISEGGRDGKGMISWKSSLNAEKMQQVASYVLSLQGNTPEKPKEQEGELWQE